MKRPNGPNQLLHSHPRKCSKNTYVDVALAVLGEQLNSVASEAFSSLLDSVILVAQSSPWPAQAQPAVLSQCCGPSGESGCLQAAPVVPWTLGEEPGCIVIPQSPVLGKGAPCSHSRVFTLSPDRWARAVDVYIASPKGSRWPLSSQAMLSSLLPAGFPGPGLCQQDTMGTGMVLSSKHPSNTAGSIAGDSQVSPLPSMSPVTIA